MLLVVVGSELAGFLCQRLWRESFASEHVLLLLLSRPRSYVLAIVLGLGSLDLAPFDVVLLNRNNLTASRPASGS